MNFDLDYGIAKRINNNKRKYVLICNKQGKHIPVSPTIAVNTMSELGENIKNKYKNIRLVIGFAETATAIGAIAAKKINNHCFYIHTTREIYNKESLEFFETHSHDIYQHLYDLFLREYINYSNTIVIIDDEISTGNTSINLINSIKKKYKCDNKIFVVASFLNSMPKDILFQYEKQGIYFEYLDRIDKLKLEKKYDTIDEYEGRTIINTNVYDFAEKSINLPNPRFGCDIDVYINAIENFAYNFVNNYQKEMFSSKVTILGTEECMLPAIIIGSFIEKNIQCDILTHSTTLSPIGICDNIDYPITKGYRFKSLYSEFKTSYIYNCSKSDFLIIVTDSNCNKNCLNQIFNINEYKETKKILINIKNV